jgi:hypothetical protein
VLPELEDPAGATLRDAGEDDDLRDRLRSALGHHVTPAFATEVAGTLERLATEGLDVLREVT